MVAVVLVLAGLGWWWQWPNDSAALFTRPSDLDRQVPVVVHRASLDAIAGAEAEAGRVPDRSAEAAGEPSPRNSGVPGSHANRGGDALWDRLSQPEILDTAVRKGADGRLRRARLVRVDEKYRLVVFEGTLPAGEPEAEDSLLEDPTVHVADHVIVRPRAGISEAEFRRSVERSGFRVGDRLAPDGPWLVELPEATTESAAGAIDALQSGGATAYAERDYLVHVADVPRSGARVDSVDGVAVLTDAARQLEDAGPDASPVPFLDPGSQGELVGRSTVTLPAGARVLTFDPPGFGDGEGDFKPYLIEQGMVVGSPGGVSVRGATSARYPNNGTRYARPLAAGLSIRHREALPFSVLALDLAEYSSQRVVTDRLDFIGYKSDGSTVEQGIRLDGVIDGTGPVPDFQTVEFGPEFTDLVEVVMSTTNYVMVDDIVVVVDGPETPLPPPPEPPLYHDVTWDPPLHEVGKPTAVGGPYAPSSIPFGTPTVREGIGSLEGPALELAGTGYQQVSFPVLHHARSYRLEFDAYLDLPTPLKILFDGAGVVQSFDFRPDGTITVFQTDVPDAGVIGRYPPRETTHVAVDVDMLGGVWELSVDGVAQYRGGFDVSLGDLSAIRFHEAGSATGRAGLDNVRIRAFGAGEMAVPGPRLVLSRDEVSFPDVQVGGKASVFLTILNGGSQALELQGVASSTPQFRVTSAEPVVLLPAGRYTVVVEFEPVEVGEIVGHLSFASNDPANPLREVVARGVGLGVADVMLEPEGGVDVAMVSGSEGSRDIAVGNRGTADLTWKLAVKAVARPYESATVPAVTPDDPMLDLVWALRDPLSEGGGIDATHAWSLTTGSETVLVAVIDSGIDLLHPELEENVWVNPGEIPDNGIDDDSNGYVDDVSGWDFANRDSLPMDDNGHGSHVAGTIAARGNNGLGFAGIGWNVRILPLKFLSESGSGFTSDAVSAVDYACRVGAKVTNNSWGGGGYSQALHDAIRAAGESGSLFVAAAGNEGLNTDVHPHYPSAYDLDCIVSVAATDADDRLAEYSNFGAATVDLAAPGTKILSLRIGDQFRFSSGTSMAAPQASGVAALLLDADPQMSPSRLKQQLMFGADSTPGLSGRMVSGGRLNAYGAATTPVPDWLRAGVDAGVLAPGESTRVPLELEVEALDTGSHHMEMTLRSNDPGQPAVDFPVTVKVMRANAYTRWLADSFGEGGILASASEDLIWGDEADPDGDRVSNLIEWVTGGNPRGYDAWNAPAMTRRHRQTFFEFRVREHHDGATYRVEWTPDLGSGEWRRDGLLILESEPGRARAGTRHLWVRPRDPRLSTAFFRLVAERSDSEL